ncbi:MAG TPA: BamA/TamA family outer membrane protein [Gammaproteobacteria bacterium]
MKRSVSLAPLLLGLLAAPATAQGPDRVYVRRIELEGVTRIADPVLRRELTQLEGAYLNTVALEQSRRRLEQLPFVASARVALRPVPGTPDTVDVVITIEEAPARRYGGGGGWSESDRGSVHGYFIHENLFGTGQRFAARVEGSDFFSFAEVSHTQPYARPEGVSRTVTLRSRDIERLNAESSALDAELDSALLEYGWRAGEAHRVRFGLELRDVALGAGPAASSQLVDWLTAVGGALGPEPSPTAEFAEADLLLGWRHDTRDRVVFPRLGREQSLEARLALPGSDVEHYALDYEVASYRPIGERWTLRLRGHLGYGAAYSAETPSVPPYARWFAGGPRSVRGYRESSLGPKDSLGNPYGGNLLLSGQVELMTPWPERWRERLRVGFFYDVGNVFATDDVEFVDDAGRPLDYGFDAAALRQSVGLAADVLLPRIGTLRVSYGVPLDAEDDHPNRFLRDDVERWQVRIDVDF